MTELPTGTVTCLFTDIKGSTRFWEQDPGAMRLALSCPRASHRVFGCGGPGGPRARPGGGPRRAERGRPRRRLGRGEGHVAGRGDRTHA